MISIIEHRAAGVSWRGDADNLDTLDGKEIGRAKAVFVIIPKGSWKL